MLATLLFYHMMQYYVSLCTFVNFNLLFSYSAIQSQTSVKYQSLLSTVALLALEAELGYTEQQCILGFF